MLGIESFEMGLWMDTLRKTSLGLRAAERPKPFVNAEWEDVRFTQRFEVSTSSEMDSKLFS